MASDWPTERLGVNCTKIGSGATPKGGKDAYLPSGPFTLIRSQNVYNEGFNASGLAFISPDQAKLLDSVTVEANDILINITGDSVARVCLAPSWVLPARVNQHVAIIRTKPDRFDSHYLRYVLISPSQQERLHSLAAVGATRNALTKGMLESLELPRPPLHFQRACAGVLASLDDRIDLLRQTNITLEAIAQTLFKSWFVDFDPVRAKAEGREPEGMDTATAALFPASLKEWWFTFSEHRVQSLVDSKLLVVGDGYRAKNSDPIALQRDKRFAATSVRLLDLEQELCVQQIDFSRRECPRLGHPTGLVSLDRDAVLVRDEFGRTRIERQGNFVDAIQVEHEVLERTPRGTIDTDRRWTQRCRCQRVRSVREEVDHVF